MRLLNPLQVTVQIYHDELIIINRLLQMAVVDGVLKMDDEEKKVWERLKKMTARVIDLQATLDRVVEGLVESAQDSSLLIRPTMKASESTDLSDP